MKRLLLLLVLLLIAPGTASLTAQGRVTLIVFAASSLIDAFEEIAESFERENPGVDVLYNFGGSSTLASQLLDGAPADAFASANNAQMDRVADAGLITSEPAVFARNRLVLIVPRDNPARIYSLMDLAEPGVKLVLAAPNVPVRDYTETMLEKMAADPLYGPAYREAVLANLVSEEDNVRQVVTKVALGEADAGIVYQSDVTPEVVASVRRYLIPNRLNVIATYPIAVLDDAPQTEVARRYVEFVLSEAGQNILTAWNFLGCCPETAQR